MGSRPPDFKTSGIRVERIIASGSLTNPRLLLIGSGATGNDGTTVNTSQIKLTGTGSDTWLFISGSIGGNDRVTFGGDVYVSGTLFGVSPGASGSSNWNELSPSPRLNSTASVSIAGGLGTSYAAQSAGSDVFFFVSGSSSNVSLFGGKVVLSGALSIKNSIGLENASISTAGNLTLAGDIEVAGGDITSAATNTSIFPTVTSISIGGGASTVSVGANATGSLFIFNAGKDRTGGVTINLGTGATTAGSLKELKFGTGGEAGSTTNIKIGNVDSAGAANVFISGSMQITGSVSVKGSIIPNADFTYNLGTPSTRWQNVYTGDLHLRNDRGDWTILEEEEFLRVINNKTGKNYKMMMQPLD